MNVLRQGAGSGNFGSVGMVRTPKGSIYHILLPHLSAAVFTVPYHYTEADQGLAMPGAGAVATECGPHAAPLATGHGVVGVPLQLERPFVDEADVSRELQNVACQQKHITNQNGAQNLDLRCVLLESKH